MFSSNDTKRSDQEIQLAIKHQFGGIVPERSVEFDELWVKLDLQFSLLSDEVGPVMRGGIYRHIEFNHRVLRVFWVCAFAAWEGYVACYNSIEAGAEIDTGRLAELLQCALDVRDAADPLSIPLPDIPEPGVFPEKVEFPELRAASECAIFVSGWAMLHEIRHIIFQQDGDSSSYGTVDEKRAEEIACDLYATNFLLDKLQEYAAEAGEDASLVARKRKIGIYFALFGLTVISKDHWGASDDHPALQDRLDAACRILQKDGGDVAMGVAGFAFAALRTLWPGAPNIPLSEVVE